VLAGGSRGWGQTFLGTVGKETAHAGWLRMELNVHPDAVLYY